MKLSELLIKFPEYKVLETNLREDEEVTTATVVGLGETHTCENHQRYHGRFIQVIREDGIQPLVLLEGIAYGQPMEQKTFQAKYIDDAVESDGWDSEAVGKISRFGSNYYTNMNADKKDELNSAYQKMNEISRNQPEVLIAEVKEKSDLPESPRTKLRRIFEKLNHETKKFSQMFVAAEELDRVQDSVAPSEIIPPHIGDESAWKDYETRTLAMVSSLCQGLQRKKMTVIIAGSRHFVRGAETKNEKFFEAISNLKYLILIPKSDFE